MLLSKLPALSLGLALATIPVSASASTFSNLFAFGDSLTDSGNVAIATYPNYQPVPFGGLMPSLAYQSGRLTNGPTWVETLAARLGVSASPYLEGGTNFAFGGARTGPLGTTPPTPPSLLNQFALFQTSTGGIAPSSALYMVWGGSNNARDAAGQKLAGDSARASATLTGAVGDLITIIGGLKSAGAVHILVPNLPDLGLSPEATRGVSGASAAATAVSVEFNALLRNSLTTFRNDPTINLIEIDTFSYFASITNSPGSFSLTNTTDPCVDLTTVCTNPDEYLFYDGLHPTAAVHRQFGEFVGTQVVVVPEPGGITGILLVTGIGALVTKRKGTGSTRSTVARLP